MNVPPGGLWHFLGESSLWFLYHIFSGTVALAHSTTGGLPGSAPADRELLTEPSNQRGPPKWRPKEIYTTQGCNTAHTLLALWSPEPVQHPHCLGY